MKNNGMEFSGEIEKESSQVIIKTVTKGAIMGMAIGLIFWVAGTGATFDPSAIFATIFWMIIGTIFGIYCFGDNRINFVYERAFVGGITGVISGAIIGMTFWGIMGVSHGLLEPADVDIETVIAMTFFFAWGGAINWAIIGAIVGAIVWIVAAGEMELYKMVIRWPINGAIFSVIFWAVGGAIGGAFLRPTGNVGRGSPGGRGYSGPDYGDLGGGSPGGVETQNRVPSS